MFCSQKFHQTEDFTYTLTMKSDECAGEFYDNLAYFIKE